MSTTTITMVLLGRTGNGKSATGNTILGRKAFKSRASASGVTSTCELQQTTLQDGQVINVIDTPGLFDLSAGYEFVGKEIIKCITMANDGIHGVLVVLSVRSRFSREEEATIMSLETLFGSKIFDYMILVFTGGDELEENDETLDDYLGHDCPPPLKEILRRCENRRLLFDNKTKEEYKRKEQLQNLLFLIHKVIQQNGGQAYTNELFLELKKGELKQDGLLKGYSELQIIELKDQMQKAYEEQLQRITKLVELKLRETITRLEQQLAEEHAARVKAEENVHMAQMKSNDEIRVLKENLEKAQSETKSLRARNEGGRCTIL